MNQEKKRFTEWATLQEMDVSAYDNPKFPEFDFADIQTQMMWECWKAAIEYTRLVGECTCPVCHEDITDSLGKAPYFITEKSSIQPSTPNGPTQHWVEGMQGCPECGATWPASYSD